MSYYQIYMLKNLRNGKQYIGITSTKISIRIKRHIDDALSRVRGKKDSLQAAIREAYDEGYCFDERFSVKTLYTNKSKAEAGWLEESLIKKYNTLSPHGYNKLKGGGSFGSKANAKRISFLIGSMTYEFPSIKKAINFVNGTIHSQNGISIKYHTVTARLRAGYTPEQAFEILPFEDKRKFRDKFLFKGTFSTRISDVADELGIPIATVRSRIYRNRDNANYDVSSPAQPKAEKAVVVPHPDFPDEQSVTGRAFSKMTGLPLSTVYWRLKKLKTSEEYVKMSRSDIIKCLTEKRTDRRKIISLRLPTGEELKGGVNELIKKVLSTEDLLDLQSDKTVKSASAIKSRLKRSEYRDIEWAFGFVAPSTEEEVRCKPLSRKTNKAFQKRPFYGHYRSNKK